MEMFIYYDDLMDIFLQTKKEKICVLEFKVITKQKLQHAF
jgi:hypothetical protein